MPLPLAEVPTFRDGAPVGYAMATVDGSGRVSDQRILRSLGWQPGDPLTITAQDGAVILRRDPRGVFALAPSTCVQIPAPLRARSGSVRVTVCCSQPCGGRHQRLAPRSQRPTPPRWVSS
ncbi:hypothetical protein AB5J62_32825 [Amycolatopsis sp. cg5]|uniref:AbrB/MazE/SpoVT family DNA-binding domain-containing protein n=1 Tax=Amycolatopsis sp. cg5 TaxID=3238802 RepID=UPI0035252B3E